MKGKYLILLTCLFISLNFIFNINYHIFLIKDQSSERLTTSANVILLEINGNQELADYCDDGVNNGSSWNSAYIIEDFIASNVFQGIWIKNTNKYLIIKNCVINNTTYGLMLSGCENIRIINCTFNYCPIGIQIERTNYGIDINNCAFYEGSIGVELRATNNVRMNNSIFYDYYTGVDIYGYYNLINNSSFFNNFGRGIYLDGLNNTISNNYFIFGIRGLEVNGDYNSIINNSIKCVNNTGIFVEGKGNLIAYNNIVNCGSDGINLNVNFIDWGIYYIASYNRIIFNNVSFNKGNGIHLMGLYSERLWRGTAYNEIYNNTITYNEQNGIVLEYPSHNNIIHNNSIFFNQQYCIVDHGYDNDYFQNENCSVFYDPPIFHKMIPSFNFILILEYMLFLSLLFVIAKFKHFKKLNSLSEINLRKIKKINKKCISISRSRSLNS